VEWPEGELHCGQCHRNFKTKDELLAHWVKIVDVWECG
jgi:hypothetical protein